MWCIVLRTTHEVKSGVQALIINTPLWSPPLCQDQNPLWNLWFRWKHLQSSISYHWITWKFWSLWSYRTYMNPQVVIKFWIYKWKQSKEIHLAWIAGDVAFMLSHAKHPNPPTYVSMPSAKFRVSVAWECETKHKESNPVCGLHLWTFFLQSKSNNSWSFLGTMHLWSFFKLCCVMTLQNKQTLLNTEILVSAERNGKDCEL